jgi:hypothetical protein
MGKDSDGSTWKRGREQHKITTMKKPLLISALSSKESTNKISGGD